MIDFIINFLNSSAETIFWVSAVVGTMFFLLCLVVSFLSGGFFEYDIDLDSLQNHVDHHSTSLFKFLSVHSLSGFLMIFGWAGLACNEQFNIRSEYSFLIALGCGLAMLMLTALIMHSVLLFQSPGAVFFSEKTVGLVGMVYQRIPAGGQGKIQLMINNSTREILARSCDEKVIESFSLVKVVRAIDHEVVEVIELT